MKIMVVVCMALALFLSVQSTLGAITCEKLDESTCSFAVSSTGTRCVLEKTVTRGGTTKYTCRSSEIQAEKLKDWTESDDCIKSCGLDRVNVGISSDSLLDSHFTHKLCSTQCYQGCPNIVDLYFNLAAGEGIFLPKLCEAQSRASSRREMVEIRSSGMVAPAPFSGLPTKLMGVAPAPFPGLPTNLMAVSPAPDSGLPTNLMAVSPAPDSALPTKLTAVAPAPYSELPANLMPVAPAMSPF